MTVEAIGIAMAAGAGAGVLHAISGPDHLAALGHGGAAPPPHAHGHAAAGLGVLHGLAGGSHLVATIPALALPLAAALANLTGFAGGSVLAMTFFAGALGGSAELFPRRAVLAHRWLMAGAGCAALVTGAWWITSGGF